MFADLISVLEENGKGIHALRKCAEEAYKRARDDADRSAAWILMASLAEDFIDANERMAVSTAHIQGQFELMSDHADLLDRVYASTDANKQLAALNTLATSLTKTSG